MACFSYTVLRLQNGEVFITQWFHSQTLCFAIHVLREETFKPQRKNYMMITTIVSRESVVNLLDQNSKTSVGYEFVEECFYANELSHFSAVFGLHTHEQRQRVQDVRTYVLKIIQRSSVYAV